MIRPVRAAAFAAAAFALAASAAWVDPLQAWQGDVARVEHPWTAHAEASPAVVLFGLNDETAAAAEVAEEDEGGVGAESLEDQVEEHADTATRGAEEDCLASAVYFEARGESLRGQLAVAEVVLNRAASELYPDTLCAVVRQRAQFSFVRRGVIPRADRGSVAWRSAVAIARIARSGARRLLDRNVLWYHANYVAPGWGRRLSRSSQIGAHIFYRS